MSVRALPIKASSERAPDMPRSVSASSAASAFLRIWPQDSSGITSNAPPTSVTTLGVPQADALE